MILCAGAGNHIHIITLADLYDPVQRADRIKIWKLLKRCKSPGGWDFRVGVRNRF